MHKTKRGIAIAALLLAGSALMTACGSNSDSDSKEITIGAILPLTGPAADLGQHSKNGLDLYQDVVNKDGGITVDGNKKKVKIIYCDTQYQAAKAISCGRKLASQDHVTGMVTVTTTETLPLYSFNTKKGSEFVIVSSAATDKIVTSKNPYAARYWFNTKTYMPGEGKLLAKANKDNDLGIKKIAVLTSDDEFGTAWTDNFSKGTEVAGFPKAATATFQQGTTDLYPQLTPLISSGADLLAMPVTCDQAAQAVKQAKELGYDGRFMFMLACDADDLKSKVANPADIDGALFESGPWNSPESPDKTFREQYKAKFPDMPFDPSASTTYSQAAWIVEAIKEAGTTDVKKVRAAMPKALKKSANTVGLTDMQKNGETTGVVHLRLVKPDGSYQEIE